MSTKHDVLHQLKIADNYLSGQALADQLSLSRNAVWKAIKSLKEEGYTIESLQNKGYKLIASPLNLNALQIQSAFPTGQVTLYQVIDSTNTQAKKEADSLNKDFAVFVASEQTQGRGRRGRTFFSPKDTGVYISLLYPASHLTPYLHLVTPLAAVAIKRAIEQVLGICVSIKWVNDLFYKNKKVCGILTEAINNLELGKVDKLVIGMGLNIYASPDLPKELEPIVGHLSDQSVDTNKLVIAIIDELLDLLEQLPNKQFLAEYRENCFILGKPVTVHPNDATAYPALAKSIDDECRLIIQKENGSLETLSFGEVSVRL